MKELTSQLRSPGYQQFFSRFVAQKDKGRFFARVRERFSHVHLDNSVNPWTWDRGGEKPQSRIPMPEPVTNLVSGDFWPQLGLWRREKAIADARQIAVPTGDEDATTRWNRLNSYLNIGWNVFNFGAMLVPDLGEAMLAVMVGQMLVRNHGRHRRLEQGRQGRSGGPPYRVMINFAQLAIMAAGHVLPTGAGAGQTPSFIDRLKKVQLPDGKTRLWNRTFLPTA